MKLFIGFDIKNRNIKVMNAEKAAEPAAVKLLHFKSHIFTDEFFIEARSLLLDCFTENPSFAGLPVYLVLPDAAVGFETFNIPNMPRRKMARALEAELINLYEDGCKSKKIKRFQLSKTKQNTTFAALYFDKNIVGKIYSLLYGFKIIPKITTYSGNAVLNCAYALSSKLRGKSFIFADVHADYTEIAVSSKGITLGFATIPHGTDILKKDEVVSEYMLTNHDVGEIAVINAGEAAKARALTLAGDSAICKDAVTEDCTVNSENPESGYSCVEEDGKIGFFGQEGLYDQEERKSFNGLSDSKGKKDKVFRKTPKRYPKFMAREFPRTPEGFQYENWRVILKWILLSARSAALSDYTASPEFIVVNMPRELYYLLDKTNEEQGENGLKFQPFSAADNLGAEIKDNLNLYGGIYASHFNKKHNY